MYDACIGCTPNKMVITDFGMFHKDLIIKYIDLTTNLALTSIKAALENVKMIHGVISSSFRLYYSLLIVYVVFVQIVVILPEDENFNPSLVGKRLQWLMT